MSDELGLDLERLLRQRGWLRALARGLVSEGEVDDLVQESWLAALSTRSRPRSSLRAWFTGLARNAARGLRRERGGAQPEWDALADARPAAGESLAQAELQERLIAAVRALREPYRATVLLHYFEELSLAEVGRRTGVPSSTARTRLARALAELRERFEREQDGSAWALVVALARGGAAGIPTAVTEVALMGTVAKVSAGVLLSGAALVALWRIRGDESRGAPHAEAPAETLVLKAPTEEPGAEPAGEPPVERATMTAEPVAIALAPAEPAAESSTSAASPAPIERELDRTAESFLTSQPDAARLLDIVGRLADEVRVVSESLRYDNFGRVSGDLVVGAGLKGSFSIEQTRYQIQLESADAGEAFSGRDLQIYFSSTDREADETSKRMVLLDFSPKQTPEARRILGAAEQYSGWALNVDPLSGTTGHPLSMQAVEVDGSPGWRMNSKPDFPSLELPWVQDTKPFERWLQRLRSFHP